MPEFFNLSMESKSDSATVPTPQFPNITNLNVKITLDLLNGTNYKDWAYTGRIRRSRRLGYIDGSINEPKKDDPKYSEWVLENMLVMNWVQNSMKGGIAKSFKYLEMQRSFGIPSKLLMLKKGIMPGF